MLLICKVWLLQCLSCIDLSRELKEKATANNANRTKSQSARPTSCTFLNPVLTDCCVCVPADTLELYYVDASGNQTAVPLVKKGIAWWTDKHVKFRNPAGGANLTAAFQGDGGKREGGGGERRSSSIIPSASATVPSR